MKLLEQEPRATKLSTFNPPCTLSVKISLSVLKLSHSTFCSINSQQSLDKTEAS